MDRVNNLRTEKDNLQLQILKTLKDKYEEVEAEEKVLLAQDTFWDLQEAPKWRRLEVQVGRVEADQRLKAKKSDWRNCDFQQEPRNLSAF